MYVCQPLHVLWPFTLVQLNQAYQLFQGLEQHATVSHLTEDYLYKFMHKHGEQMEDIRAHLGVLHNLSTEVNDLLNNLDMGSRQCRDVPIESLPSLGELGVSPSISAIGGGEQIVKEPLIMTVEENKIPLLLWVCS